MSVYKESLSTAIFTVLTVGMMIILFERFFSGKSLFAAVKSALPFVVPSLPLHISMLMLMVHWHTLPFAISLHFIVAIGCMVLLGLIGVAFLMSSTADLTLYKRLWYGGGLLVALLIGRSFYQIGQLTATN